VGSTALQRIEKETRTSWVCFVDTSVGSLLAQSHRDEMERMLNNSKRHITPFDAFRGLWGVDVDTAQLVLYFRLSGVQERIENTASRVVVTEQEKQDKQN
jgi:hypothetical protein